MAIVNITTENDADFIRGFVYQFTDLTPVDLTGSQLRMGIRRKATDIIEVLLLTTENGGFSIYDPTNGKFTMHISNEQLLEIGLGDFEQSLIRITTADQMRYRIWSGALTVTAGPSR